MIKRIAKLSSLSGLLWFVSDIFWFWKIHQLAFWIGILAVISTFLLFFIKENILDNNKRITIVLNIWLWLNMIALCKDTFILNENVSNVLTLIGGLLTIISGRMLMDILMKEKELLEKFKRF